MENSKTVFHAKAIVIYVANLTTEAACEALRGAGMTCSPEDVQIIARDERWAVLMPSERIAWFPASELGHRRLTVERRVLHLLAERCSYRAPRILFVSACGFDVRQWFLADAIRGISFIVAKRIRGWRRGSAVQSAGFSPSNI